MLMNNRTCRKKTTIIVIACALAAVVFAARAEAKPRIYFTGAPSRVLKGSTFDVNLVVEGVKNLYGIEAEAIYNGAVIASSVANNIQAVPGGAVFDETPENEVLGDNTSNLFGNIKLTSMPPR